MIWLILIASLFLYFSLASLHITFKRKGIGNWVIMMFIWLALLYSSLVAYGMMYKDASGSLAPLALLLFMATLFVYQKVGSLKKEVGQTH